MEEEILTMAKVIAKPEAGEEAYLRTLCAAEEAQLRRKLKGPLEDQGHSAFVCAAAALAAADYYAGKGAVPHIPHRDIFEKSISRSLPHPAPQRDRPHLGYAYLCAPDVPDGSQRGHRRQ